MSRVPELHALQVSAGVGRCCFCLKPITKKRPQGNIARVCRSADCRAEEENARARHRRAATRALRALRNVVAAIGWSTAALTRAARGATR